MTLTAATVLFSCAEEAPKENETQELVEQVVPQDTVVNEDSVKMAKAAQLVSEAWSEMQTSQYGSYQSDPTQDYAGIYQPNDQSYVDNFPAFTYDSNGFGTMGFPTALSANLAGLGESNVWVVALPILAGGYDSNMLSISRNDSNEVVVDIMNAPLSTEPNTPVDTVLFYFVSPVDFNFTNFSVTYKNPYAPNAKMEKEKSKKVFGESTGEGWEKPSND